MFFCLVATLEYVRNISRGKKGLLAGENWEVGGDFGERKIPVLEPEMFIDITIKRHIDNFFLNSKTQ